MTTAPRHRLLAMLTSIPEATPSSCAPSDVLSPDAIANVRCDLTATVGHEAGHQLFPDARGRDSP